MDALSILILKYIIFVCNILFALSGIGLITAGAFVYHDMQSYEHFVERRISIMPLCLIVAGIIVFLVAFIGCYGATVENYGLLMTFSVILSVIFISQLSVGVSAAIYNDEFAEIVKDSLNHTMRTATDTSRQSWSVLQKTLKCCGLDHAKEWLDIRLTEHLPAECCRGTGADFPCVLNSIHVYPKGCYTVLQEKLGENITIIASVGITFAFVELVGVVIACYLGCGIRNQNVGK